VRSCFRSNAGSWSAYLDEAAFRVVSRYGVQPLSEDGLATGAFGIAARVFQAAAKNREIPAGRGPFGSLTPFRKPFTVNMLL
jgi:hypothetical protein